MHVGTSSRLPLIICLLGIGPLFVSAQETPSPAQALRESVSLATSSTAVKQFEAVRDQIAGGQWREAIDLLDQIVDAHGDTLIPVSPGRYLNSGMYANLLLSGLPVEGRTAYRNIVDAQAKEWFTVGRENRDQSELGKIVARSFNSSYGDDALFLLGEWAWQRGDLDAAHAYWRQILPSTAEHPPGHPLRALHYPDTDLNRAEITARLVLCSLARLDRSRAARELKAFARLFPAAEGALAGRRGKLADILRAVANESDGWLLPDHDQEVATFALNAARNSQLRRAVEVGSVVWSRRLPRLPLEKKPKQPAFGVADALCYHPATFGDLALVNSAGRIFAWNLRTGKAAWATGEEDQGMIYPAVEPEQNLMPYGPVVGTPHYTMTIDDGRLYARMGTPIVESSQDDQLHSLPSDLICLDLAHGEGKLVWKVSAQTFGPSWMFAGSPLVADGHVYVVLRQGRPQTQLSIACLEAETGNLVWNRKVCAAISHLGETNSLIGHQLLTRAGETLFLSTDVGAVAALDVRDGRLQWVVTYESRLNQARTDAEELAGRSLVPCLASGGLVIAAPRDYDAVMAIDAASGIVVWERRLLGKVDHLLGIGTGNLIVSGDRLWGLDLMTGKVHWHVGSGDPATFGYGRGLLAGKTVYWPKREEIFVVDQATGRLRRRIAVSRLHGVSGGNLTIAGGMLLIAQPNRLVTCGPLSRRKSDDRPQKISANAR